MLILCEKPSVARDFAAALGVPVTKTPSFTGNGYVITWCVGHLFELRRPDYYNPKYKQWRIEDLPILPENWAYEIKENAKDRAECVMSLLREHKNDEVLIATDAGREGEYIARLCIQEADISDISRFRRFWVSEALTADVILNGIQAAKPLTEYNALAAQGYARARADWLTGMNLSRLMSIGNPQPAFAVGRCQTAVLAAIAHRNRDVQNFIKTPYKELEASVADKAGYAVKALLENSASGKTAFFGKDEAYLNEAAAYCNANKAVNKTDAKTEQKREKPPKLLNITGLQKEAYKRFGYTPEDTLNIAQSLYETHKCLSYPRTPSRVMGDNNVDLFREKFELLRGTSDLSKLCDVNLICPENKHIFNSKQLEDHHALIPLGKLPDSADDKERGVYAGGHPPVLVRHLIAYGCSVSSLWMEVSENSPSNCLKLTEIASETLLKICF